MEVRKAAIGILLVAIPLRQDAESHDMSSLHGIDSIYIHRQYLIMLSVNSRYTPSPDSFHCVIHLGGPMPLFIHTEYRLGFPVKSIATSAAEQLESHTFKDVPFSAGKVWVQHLYQHWNWNEHYLQYREHVV